MEKSKEISREISHINPNEKPKEIVKVVKTERVGGSKAAKLLPSEGEKLNDDILKFKMDEES